MTFEADVNAWTRKTQARLEAVFKSSVQEVARQAQVPQEKGGNLPVDTGFLRNSGQAALNRMPSGDSFQDASDSAGKQVMDATAVTIARANLGDAIIFGWTAEYAPFMEARYAFMRTAAANWRSIVAREADRIKARVAG